jgi:DNA-directed RNA polymerase specialized sigma24 family protein
MPESTSAVPASPLLFQLCADNPDNDEYWSLFIQRFNPLLVRSVVVAWRKSGQGNWPPPGLATDLLQDVYTGIVKNDFRLLRNFRGSTEAEAEAYLRRAAINQTISFLRKGATDRRTADEISLDELIKAEGEEGRLTIGSSGPAKSLTERELIETLQRCFDGPNGKRDVLIFLLHARDGYSVAEIAAMGVCELKETSIANLLGKMKTDLRKCFSI